MRTGHPFPLFETILEFRRIWFRQRRSLKMSSRFVKTRVISIFAIAAVLVFHSAAWSQDCTASNVGDSTSCLAPDIRCSATHDAGKSVPKSVCGTNSKAKDDSACSCQDAKREAKPSAPHSQQFRSKSGGGTTALATFVALLGLWCLAAIKASRMTNSV